MDTYSEPNNAEELARLIIKSKQSSFDKEEMAQYIKENFSLEQMVDKNLNVYHTLNNKRKL